MDKVKITTQLNPECEELVELCKDLEVMDKEFPSEEADRIFGSLIAVFGTDPVMSTITRTHTSR